MKAREKHTKNYLANGVDRCSKCGEVKPLDQFYVSKKKWTGHDPWCKKCKLVANQAYVKDPINATKKREYRKIYNFNNKERQRINTIKHRYGITVEQYAQMWEDQDGKCKICGIALNTIPQKQIAIDHCHESNIIRGILCRNCNAGLGFFRDNITVLKKAIKYLKCHKEKHDTETKEREV